MSKLIPALVQGAAAAAYGMFRYPGVFNTRRPADLGMDVVGFGVASVVGQYAAASLGIIL